MIKLLIFYLEGCPYCRNAREAVKELQSENPVYQSAKIEWIEENESPEIANEYDYYRVPSIFCGKNKLYECSPTDDYNIIKKNIDNAFKFVLKVKH
ncbi:MAG: thioredoxin family protein [Clostridia bacterium]|nr:thioredoxin family protein [Clostridia bacterium]